MRKPAFAYAICICKNKKHIDQLLGNRAADQSLCFQYIDSMISLLVLPKSEISSFKLFSFVVKPSLCRTWLEIPKICFLMTQLIYYLYLLYRDFKTYVSMIDRFSY